MNKYKNDDAKILSNMMGELAIKLNTDINDYLGKLYMDTMPQSKLGQFFTPFHVSQLTSNISVKDSDIKSEIDKKGKIVLYEPSCGSGGMILAFIKRLKDMGYEPSRVLEVHAGDIDINSVYMTYIQLSMLNINARVVRGDSLNATLGIENKDIFDSPLLIGRRLIYG